MRTIFDYSSYKAFITDTILGAPHAGRGQRRKLAESIGCQVAYISHVLGGESHFNLEQADAAGRYFGLNNSELDYFLALVSYNRASTRGLKATLKRQMEEKIKARASLKERLRMTEKLSHETQMTYYSHWSYAAIHIALTVPSLRTREAIANLLSLPFRQVDEVLHFLVANKLADRHKSEYITPEGSLHLPKTSPLIAQHHSNWRLQAISKVRSESDDEMHYSGVFSIGKEDVGAIKEIMTRALESSMKVVAGTQVDEVCALCIDLFRP